jgi:hypothetical protein
MGRKSKRARTLRFAALPEIAKRNDVTGELQILGIGKLKVQVRVVKGRRLKLECEPVREKESGARIQELGGACQRGSQSSS